MTWPGDHAAAQPANPVLADGLRWGLAAVLVVQTFTGMAPSLVLVGVLLSRSTAQLDPAFLAGGLIPWLVYLGTHLAQVHYLRQLGPYPYSSVQVALMALLPGYNLFGAVELYGSQGEAMERLGAGEGLAFEVRGAAAMASSLALALMLLVTRWLAPIAFDRSRPVPQPPPGLMRAIIITAVALLLARLYVLARLQLATRALAAARLDGPPPALPAAPAVPGLPGPGRSIAAIALALVGAGFTVAGSGAVPAAPQDLSIFSRAPIVKVIPERSAPAPAPEKAVAARPAAPAKPALPPDTLLGGRTVEWWRDRLRALRLRADEEGKGLYQLTRERAVLNGLVVTDVGDGLQVEPSPQRIAAARAEVAP